MRKILIYLIAIINIYACSKNDDDNNEVIPEPINKPPTDFSLIEVGNGEEGVNLSSVDLKWEESIDPEGKEIKYNLYLDKGSSEPTNLIASSLSSNSYQLDNLEYYTNYSWKVLAQDIVGNKTSSEIFSFLTKERFGENVLENAPFEERNSFAMVNFNQRMWIIDGIQQSDIWSSLDGINWENKENNSFPGRLAHSAVVFKNKIWIIGGVGFDESTFQDIVYNDVWSSSDGINWEKAIDHANFTPRYSHTTVVFKDKIWLIGGEDGDSEFNDVWSSSDGINWVKETENGNFLPRFSHSSFVFQDKIWIIGGVNSEQGAGEGFLNDVWSSLDGKNWNEVIHNAPFSNRFGHTSKIYNEKIILVGGRPEESAFTNDIWVSSDGLNWIQQAENSNFPGRRNHSSLVFNDKLWIIGGTNVSDLNDIWYLD